MKHIGSGSYADVFRQQQQERGLIFKLIRLLPEYLVDRIQGSSLNRATKYMDAFSEFQISIALCKLKTGLKDARDGFYTCQMFPQVYHGFLAHGALPSYFKLDPEEKSDNKNEDIYTDYFLTIQRENMVIVMEVLCLFVISNY